MSRLLLDTPMIYPIKANIHRYSHADQASQAWRSELRNTSKTTLGGDRKVQRVSQIRPQYKNTKTKAMNNQ